MRAFIIWTTGLAAFGLFGSLVGWALTGKTLGEQVGIAAGACLFICLRLWFANVSVASSKKE